MSHTTTEAKLESGDSRDEHENRNGPGWARQVVMPQAPGNAKIGRGDSHSKLADLKPLPPRRNLQKSLFKDACRKLKELESKGQCGGQYR